MSRYLSAIALMILLAFLAFFGIVSAYGPETPTASLDQLKSNLEESLDQGNLDVEQTAVTIAKDYPGEYNLNQVSEVFEALRKGWYYYSDPSYKDKYKSANRSLQDGKISDSIGMGDCDDFAILMASLLEALQGSTRIVFAYDQDTRPNHAYAEVYLGKKSDPRVNDLISWLKEQYNQTEISGQAITGDEVWLNLDYNSTYPGGRYFGEERRVVREVVWQSASRNSPKIVPIIDTMDSTAGWEEVGDEKGSNVSISSVPSPKGKAIQIDFDLKEGGRAGIYRNVSGSILSQVKGLNLSYYGLDKQITIQLILAYGDGICFGYSWKPEPGNKWTGLDALFEDFIRQGSGISSAGQRLDPRKVEKLEIICQLDEKDLPGTGRIIIDNIRGAMNIPQGSPWERAEKQRKKTLALELASKSETSRNEVLHSISQNQTVPLIESLELAVESIRNYDTLAGEQALRRGLELLPCPLARLAHNNTVTWVAFSPDGKRLATASDDNSTRIWDVETGKELERMEFNDGVIFVTFGLDGRNLATASRDNVATLWNTETGKELVRTAFSGKLDCIALSPDGRRFATASGSMVKLWDAEDGNELDQIEHDDDVVSVIFSPDGKKFASASSD